MLLLQHTNNNFIFPTCVWVQSMIGTDKKKDVLAHLPIVTYRL